MCHGVLYSSICFLCSFQGEIGEKGQKVNIDLGLQFQKIIISGFILLLCVFRESQVLATEVQRVRLVLQDRR